MQSTDNENMDDRDAFLLSAREAAHWTSIDQGAIDRAWEERRRVRSLAEVLLP
jgi:hypothetical protein